jgi:tetratricopeptide (TPR) repeat protein
LPSARRAAARWTEELAHDPQAFEAAWKLGRADYWLGNHAPEAERRMFLESGIDAGRKAVAIAANRPEGHFWIAANMGSLADSFGLRQGLKYRGAIREELETVLRLDPAFQSGSADRALGRWYFKVPGLFGGSNKQAEAHLRLSLKYDEQSTVGHFFLAELFIDQNRKDEARSELRKVLDVPFNADWAAENEDYKVRARTLLATLK